MPITGAEVRLYNPGWIASQRTNAAGVYVITGLRPGNTYQALARVWTKCTVHVDRLHQPVGSQRPG